MTELAEVRFKPTEATARLASMTEQVPDWSCLIAESRAGSDIVPSMRQKEIPESWRVC